MVGVVLELVDMVTWEEVDVGWVWMWWGFVGCWGRGILGDMKVDEQKNARFLSIEERKDFLSLCMGNYGNLT